MNGLVAPALAAGIMDLNPGLTLWTAITFLLLMVVLGKVAWRPIVKMLDERERTIRETIDQTRKERAEAEKLLADQKESLARARREAADLAKKSQQEIEALRADLTARARKEADELIASARRAVEEEKAKAAAELKAQVADMAVAAATRIVKSSLDEKAQRGLVEEYLRELPAGQS